MAYPRHDNLDRIGPHAFLVPRPTTTIRSPAIQLVALASPTSLTVTPIEQHLNLWIIKTLFTHLSEQVWRVPGDNYQKANVVIPNGTGRDIQLRP